MDNPHPPQCGVHTDLDRNDVGFASVVDESGDVSVSPRVDAIRVAIFIVEIEEV